MDNLESGIKSNPKKFWSYMKAKKACSEYPNKLFYKVDIATDPAHAANLFASFFKANFSPSDSSSNSHFCKNAGSLLDFGSLTIDENDIFLAIDSLNSSCKPDADCLSPYFFKMCAYSICAPLKQIFNCSLQSGIFIDLWKISEITPVFKKGDKSNIENYRPIAKLSTVSKLLESIVKSKLSFLLKNVVCLEQHGFFKGRSAVSNLMIFTKSCYETLSQSKQVDVIYTDFAKAFDKVSHKILLAKLCALGFHSAFLLWLQSYLEDRQCFVRVEGCNPRPFIATSGVPQGSILGPLLFTLFINDIGCNFKHCQFLLYADDLKLFRTINSISDMYYLQVDLNSLFNWCNKNQLFLNIEKCFIMSYCKSRELIPTKYNIDSCDLCRVDQMNDLGVIFDSKLTFIHHLNYMIPKAYRALSFIIRHSSNFKDPYTVKILFTSFVRSRLEYAASIWNPYYVVHSNRIERVQRVFTKFALRPLFRKVVLPDYKARYLLLGLKSLETRRTFLSIMFLFDLINNHVDCPCLLDAVPFYVPSRSLRRNYNIFFLYCHKSKFASNEPIIRSCKTCNELSANYLIDFSISRSIFKEFLNNIL